METLRIERDASSPTEHRLLIACVGVVLAIAIVLRFACRVDLWLDEALTVNISRLPLSEIPHALRHDGAPPLYYVLLHFWMRVFGEGDVSVRALSGVLGVAGIPLAFASGRLIARRAGTDGLIGGAAAAVLIAVLPFGVRYSTETRMYSLAIVLTLLGHLALWRALDRPTIGRLTAVGLVTAALLYTYYWCAFLIAVVAAVLVSQAVWGAPARRAASRRVLLGMIAGGGLFLPWVPTMLWQQKHTGTPWATRPTSPAPFITTLTQFGGGHNVDGRTLTIVIATLTLIGLWHRRAAIWELGVGLATLEFLFVAAVASNSAYQIRYAAVVFPLFVLAASAGVPALRPRLRWVAFAVVAVLGLTTSWHVIDEPRTQAGQVAAALRTQARSGDVVLYCPDQIAPDTARLLPASAGLRQYAFPTFAGPDLINWTDYARRNAAGDPERFASEAINRAARSNVWVVMSPGYRTYDLKCEQLITALESRLGPQHWVVPLGNVFEHMALVRFGAP